MLTASLIRAHKIALVALLSETDTEPRCLWLIACLTDSGSVRAFARPQPLPKSKAGIPAPREPTTMAARCLKGVKQPPTLPRVVAQNKTA